MANYEDFCCVVYGTVKTGMYFRYQRFDWICYSILRVVEEEDMDCLDGFCKLLDTLVLYTSLCGVIFWQTEILKTVTVRHGAKYGPFFYFMVGITCLCVRPNEISL